MIEPCHQPDELIKIDVPVSVLINDAHHVLIVLTSKVLVINPCGHLQFLLFWIPSKSSHHLLKLLHSNGSSAISVKEREYFSVFCQLFWGQIFYDLQRQSLRYQTIIRYELHYFFPKSIFVKLVLILRYPHHVMQLYV